MTNFPLRVPVRGRKLKSEEEACERLTKGVKQMQSASAVDTSAHKKERQQLDTMRRQAATLAAAEEADATALEALLVSAHILLDQVRRW